MSNIIYKKDKRQSIKVLTRVLGLFLFFFGLSIVIYIFSPLILWQLTLAPAFAESQITIPIPQRTLVTPVTLKSLVTAGMQSLAGIDFTNAANWYPSYTFTQRNVRESSYLLTIPKLGISNAFVSTVDNNLAAHLVNLAGTAIPPEKGNTVIFGHSTLPQLYNPKDYKTIFANAHTLQIGDTIQAIVDDVVYTYKIFSITVVDPEDTSVLSQIYDDSYMTLITCTPPGTIWKRLIVKARLQSLK